MSLRIETREYTHFHFFCGIGMGAAGFNEGTARLGNLEARLRCIGGIDVDKDAIANFDRFAGVKGTCMDLFTLEQYIAFHGKAPPLAGAKPPRPTSSAPPASNVPTSSSCPRPARASPVCCHKRRR